MFDLLQLYSSFFYVVRFGGSSGNGFGNADVSLNNIGRTSPSFLKKQNRQETNETTSQKINKFEKNI